MSAFPEAPRWDEVETKQHLGMYNDATRCIDSVIFPEQDLAIA